MPGKTSESQKILRRFKELPQHLQEGETPLLSLPAIWDNGRARHSTACDVIITNLRIFGYISTRFPRPRLFLDALSLADIQAVSLRQKSFEPVFRELFVSTGQRSVYIRAPRQKIEKLYNALRLATGQDRAENALILTGTAVNEPPATPGQPLGKVVGKQEIHVSFERSSLAIVALFVGGLLLEIGGALLWQAAQSEQAGLPLCIAGFVAVVTGILLARERR